MAMKKNEITTKKPKKTAKKEPVIIGKKDFLKKVGNEAYELSGTAVSQEVLSHILDAMLEVIEGEVRVGNSIRFIGFGTFKQQILSARKGRNPQTGKEIQIPETKHLAFHSKVKF